MQRTNGSWSRALFSGIWLFAAAAGEAAPADALAPSGPVILVGEGVNGRVAMFSDGGFVVVWNAPDTIRAQFFDHHGVPTSGAIALLRPAGQLLTSVAALPDGFVVVWEQANEHRVVSVYARVFDRAGSPVSRPFKVHANSIASRTNGFVAPAPGGGFAVACQANDTRVTTLARFFGPTGSPLGPSVDPFYIDEYVVIVGARVGPDGVLSVALDRSNADSDPLVVRTDRTGSQLQPLGLGPSPADFSLGIGDNYRSISLLPDGGFRIAWASAFGTGGFGDVSTIYAQRFDAGGGPIGDPVKVSGRPGWANAPLQAPLPDGGFVVAYGDLGQSGGGLPEGGPLLMRPFNADQAPATRPLRINLANNGNQFATDLAAGLGNEAVVVWSERGTDSMQPGHVLARILRTPG
jgi:hypothetical protein